GYEQDQEAAIVLQYGVALHAAVLAPPHHEIHQREIERGEGVPSDEQARHQPRRRRQQEERDDAKRDRNKGARPRVNYSHGFRKSPETKKGLFELVAGHWFCTSG